MARHSFEAQAGIVRPFPRFGPLNEESAALAVALPFQSAVAVCVDNNWRLDKFLQICSATATAHDSNSKMGFALPVKFRSEGSDSASHQRNFPFGLHWVRGRPPALLSHHRGKRPQKQPVSHMWLARSISAWPKQRDP